MVDSFFFYPGIYRAVVAFRTALATCFWLALLAAVGWLWPMASAVRPTGVLDLVTTTGWVHRWVAGPGPRAVPALVAMVVFLVARHLGARIVLPELRPVLSAVAGAVAVLGTAAWALRAAGQPWWSWAPSGVALVVGLRLRRRAGRARCRSTTQAGFRPSWRAGLGPRSALHLFHSRRADTGVLSWGRSDTAQVLDDATQWFADRNDPVSQAWCIARLVESQLDHNDVSGAELRIRRGLRDDGVKQQPAFLAACAKFYSAVGENESAARVWQDIVEGSRRLPTLARIQAKEAAAQSAGPPWQVPEVGDWRRLALIWTGQTPAVVRDLANSMSLLSPEGGVDLLEEGYALCALPTELSISLSYRDVGLGGYHLMLSARGTALAAIAETYRRLGSDQDVALAYLDAFEDFHQTHERRPGAACLLRSFTAAIGAGYDAPDQESHALDCIRGALQLMESDRLALFEPDFRQAWIRSRRALLEEVFERLVLVDTQQAKAAELGVWLLESLHRTLVVNLMAAEHLLITDTALLAAQEELARHESRHVLDRLTRGERPDRPPPPDDERTKWVADRLHALAAEAPVAGPVDLDEIFRRLRGHYAVLFQCARDGRGWTVHGALITPDRGLRLHRARIDSLKGDTMSSSLLNPVGALDALAGADDELLGPLFHSDLAVPVWRELSQAIIPASWWDVLPGEDEKDVELFIVPDGPLARLPFAALPTPQGRPLAERMVLNLIPALAFLRDEPDPRASRPVRVAAVNLHSERLEGSDKEAAAWTRTRDRIEVRETGTRDELARVLEQTPQPDTVVISAHGESGTFDGFVTLKDGTHLTAAGGLTLPWPPAVVLGSCWINHMDVETGQEPFGLPLACLMRGATTVIGGSAPVTSALTGSLLAELVDSLPDGNITSTRLHHAIAARTRGIDAEWLLPQDFALLTAWTTAPAASRPAAYPATAWAVDATARSETTTTGTCRPDPGWGDTLLGVLRQAVHATGGAPVGTLAFLAATVTGDRRDADWTSFKVACEIGDPPREGTTAESEQGTVTLLLDDTRIPLSIKLYRLLGEGTNTARALDAETVTPAHVTVPVLLDSDSEAAAWLRTHATGTDPLQALEERVLQVPLPEVEEILGTPPSTRSQRTPSAWTNSRTTTRKPAVDRPPGTPGSRPSPPAWPWPPSPTYH